MISVSVVCVCYHVLFSVSAHYRPFPHTTGLFRTLHAFSAHYRNIMHNMERYFCLNRNRMYKFVQRTRKTQCHMFTTDECVRCISEQLLSSFTRETCQITTHAECLCITNTECLALTTSECVFYNIVMP